MTADVTIREARLSDADIIARFNCARHHRVLTATHSDDGLIYEMAFQVFSWFDTVTPPRGSRIDLAPLAGRFQESETGGEGRWTYAGNESLDARMIRAGPGGQPVASSLPLDMVEGRLIEFFAGRP